MTDEATICENKDYVNAFQLKRLNLKVPQTLRTWHRPARVNDVDEISDEHDENMTRERKTTFSTVFTSF